MAASWMKAALLLAAIYNLLWGAVVVLFPFALFDAVGMERPRYPGIWQCVGMIVGVYGIGYAIAAFDPLRHWPIVLVGLLGKLLGPIGFVDAALRGALPWSFGVTILTNDLIWWVPFSLILLHAWRHHGGEARTMEQADFRKTLQDFTDQYGTSLSALAHQRPMLVVFLRHFGCTFCREALDDLRRQRDRINGSDVGIAIVHMSDDATAARYVQRYGLDDVSRISDPQRTLYQAFGLRRGSLGQLFGPRVLWRGVAATLRGHSVGKLTGDGFQMPGAFVLHQDEITKAFRHQTAGDRPAYDELACELRQADGSPAGAVPHVGSS